MGDQLNIYRIIKFGIVGGCGMLVDFGLTYLFKEKLQFKKYIANTIGFTVAVIFNYFLNRYWTFQSGGQIQAQLVRFFLVALVGLGLNTAIVYALSRRAINFYVSKLIAVGIVFIWNYTANSYFTFG